MKPDPSFASPRHPVRLVAQRTGLSPHVLRAWERRYRAVRPSRSAGGQRLYSDLDIERLQLLRQLTESGHSIGQLAQLTLEELSGLASREPSPEPPVPGPSEAASALEALRNEAFQATLELDGARLQNVLDRAVVSLGVPAFLDHLVAPLLHGIGQGWRDGRLGIGHEHLATAVFRRVLGWILRTCEVGSLAPVIVVATPPGQIHELGAMMVAGTAAAEGWGVVYLGANLPVADIVAAVRQCRPRAVALSLVHPVDDPALGSELTRLRQGLPDDILLLIGGGAAEAYRDRLPTLGTRLLPDLSTLRGILRSLPDGRTEVR